jgi:hypothetical protein
MKLAKVMVVFASRMAASIAGKISSPLSRTCARLAADELGVGVGLEGPNERLLADRDVGRRVVRPHERARR